MAEEMSELEIVQYLRRKLQAGINDEDGEASEERQNSFDYYVGKDYGNERSGFSQVVTRETMEVIEWVKPSVMRALNKDDAVEFDPVGREDEDQAKQETKVVQHVMRKANEGFLETYEWVNDILMYPNGYLKVYPEEKTEVLTRSYEGLTAEQMDKLIERVGNGEITILNQEMRQMPVETPVGHVLMDFYDVEYEEERTTRKINIEAMEPEDTIIDENWGSVDLDGCPFVAHKFKDNYTDLVQQGMDADRLDLVRGGDSLDWEDEEVNRRYVEDENPDSQDETHDAMREFVVYECWVRLDVDGDGLAEQRRIVMIGNEIFENDEVPYQPVVSCSSVVMSHKHIGMSYAMLMMDLQLIRSVIKRQILDNAYRLNVPRKYLGERFYRPDGVTESSLADAEEEHIPVRDPSQMMQEQVTPIIDQLLAVDASLRDDIQNRTGVAPQLSLDPNVLRESTGVAYMGAMEQATQRIELLVRLIAETGVKKVAKKVHTLLRLFQDVPLTMKITGDWVTVNPSEWEERENMTVNIGLGNRNNSEQLMALERIGMQQEGAMEMGMARPIHLYNNLAKQVELSGVGAPEQFYEKPDPEAPAPNPQQGQEQMMAQQLQMQGQLAQQQQQMEHQQRMAKEQREMMEGQARMQLEMQKEQRASRESMAKIAEIGVTMEKMREEIGRIAAETAHTRMDTVKTREEARAQDIENDQNVSGVTALVEEAQQVLKAN